MFFFLLHLLGQWNVTPLPSGEESHLLEAETGVSLASFEVFSMDVKDVVQSNSTPNEKPIEDNRKLHEDSSTSNLEGFISSESEALTNTVQLLTKVHFVFTIDYNFVVAVLCYPSIC